MKGMGRVLRGSLGSVMLATSGCSCVTKMGGFEGGGGKGLGKREKRRRRPFREVACLVKMSNLVRP